MHFHEAPTRQMKMPWGSTPVQPTVVPFCHLKGFTAQLNHFSLLKCFSE
jgi:hypothetical protein